MGSKYVRRRLVELRSPVAILPQNAQLEHINREWSLDDIADAICAQICLQQNRASAKSVELDATRDEAEKNIDLLLACSELARIAQWPFYLHLRLTRLILALHGLSKGFRDPMLEPKNPVPGRAAPSVARWRISCVIAVEAKVRFSGITPKDATRAIMKELKQAIEFESSSVQWKVLFPLRGRAEFSDEEERRCASIDEWSKPRTVQRLKEPVSTEFELLSKAILNCSEDNRKEAYLFALSLAVLQAKSLLASRG